MVRESTPNKAPGQANPGLAGLIAKLPKIALDFKGSEFAQPAAQAYLGTRADAESIARQAEQLLRAPVEQTCELALIMAEIIESAMPDRDKYFQPDAKVRSHVFMGAKWRAGWVFLIGGADHSELARKFNDLSFLVFAQNGSTLKNVIDLGPRETAAAYFLQVMARYAMIWGGIKPGDDHEMGHFLEKDLPGVVVAQGKLTPIEEILLLGLMKMGAPAVVPPEYPWDLGRQVKAAGIDQIVEAARKFPNLRLKDIQGRIIELPVFCDPANLRAEFTAEGRIGGKGSFFVLKPGEVEEGISVPKDLDFSGNVPIGILVEIGDRRLDIATSEYLEKDGLRGIGTIAGVRAEQLPDSGFVIHLARGTSFDPQRVALAVQSWLKYEFPYLEKIRVTLVNGEEAGRMKGEVDKYRAERERMIEHESDDTVKYFNYCLECQPFSKDHVCIITPDRPPMCGRDRFQIKSAALFGASWHPWKRQELSEKELRGSIAVGQPLNAAAGEYAEVNQALEKLSPSHLKRVQLHAIRECPHTSCGCFQFLVFRLESLGGIGIMERDYPGEAPEGLTWNKLANAAGGKQTPGVAGVSRNYLKSKRFMQGEGGLGAVRWVSPRAFEALKDRIPHPENVQVGANYPAPR
jgi:acetyl-CoA decarbonylase/synthase complex subunit beta